VLFSREDVAAYVNRCFEPVWESVRPVPIVRVDFGNGTVLTRTLHGNIATYVCTAGGQALDILPGIYTPQAYLEQLNQFRLLANYVDQLGKTRREARLIGYHLAQADALKKDQAPPRFVNMADASKKRIENGLVAVLQPSTGAMPRIDAKETPGNPSVGSPEDLASWKALTADTQLNEHARRLQIHDLLA